MYRPIALLAFAVFWWLLHTYGVIMIAVAMFGKTIIVVDPMSSFWGVDWFIEHPLTSLAGICWFIALPLVTLL